MSYVASAHLAVYTVTAMSQRLRMLHKTIWKMCDSYIIQCLNECGVISKCRNIDSHLKNDCPLTIVQCDFQYAGCETELLRQK